VLVVTIQYRLGIFGFFTWVSSGECHSRPQSEAVQQLWAIYLRMNEPSVALSKLSPN
jgi:carboxylesterase type B